MLQAVRRCRRWASAPGPARLALWITVVNKNCDKIVNKGCKQKLWTKGVKQRCEQKVWIKVVNKSCEQKLLIKVVNKTWKQKFWTKVFNKRCEQKLWTKVVKKSSEQNCEKSCEITFVNILCHLLGFLKSIPTLSLARQSWE